MTQREWEKEFFKQLKPLPRKERKLILEYYRELFADKREAGKSEYAILLDLGSPEACAARILAEDYGDLHISAKKGTQNGVTAAYITGMIFLSLLVILPLAAVACSLIVAFGAVTLGMGALMLGGLLLTVWSLFQISLGFSYVLAVLGIALAMLGLGSVLLVGFWMLTEYSAKGVWMAFQWIYGRGKYREKTV